MKTLASPHTLTSARKLTRATKLLRNAETALGRPLAGGDPLNVLVLRDAWARSKGLVPEELRAHVERRPSGAKLAPVSSGRKISIAAFLARHAADPALQREGTNKESSPKPPPLPGVIDFSQFEPSPVSPEVVAAHRQAVERMQRVGRTPQAATAEDYQRLLAHFS